jgi:LysM repeat protein
MVAAAHVAPAPVTYHVKRGDTLSQIALDYYGRASAYPEIAAYNHIENPDLIYAGSTLTVPRPSFTPKVTAEVLPPVTHHIPKHKVHHVPKHAKPTPKYTPAHAASGNVVQIARYLSQHGGTKAGAAGVAACIWGESGGNPESVGSGGFGLIGWTGNNIGLPGGYFGPTGNVTADMDTQLAGVVGYIGANGGWGPINAAGGPVGAAQVFSAKYERPAVQYSDIHYGGAGDPTAIFNAI